MSYLKPLIVAVLFGVPAVASAESLLALNGLRTQSGAGSEIEVFTRAGSHGSDYFCAAGDFARRKLGADTTDRIVISRAPGGSPTRANQRSMGFKLVPAGAKRSAKNSFVLSPRNIGLSRTVGHSVFLCKNTKGSRIND
ncbi:hypothetical protein [Parasulfitobacter algicola]|uniref:Uncharacterized protein n=1 Tax=Parasulfitobacter algicola TaxID=2614809 RepID=A0ABX2IMC0_9RHOB|nr:hypothetical protein [Sulfitobacter algicola]NSX54027.1 hypothetical protein [Sulfitobacter algicola]